MSSGTTKSNQDGDEDVQIGPMIALLEEQWDWSNLLVECGPTLLNHDGSPLLKQHDLIRILLALRYNGFESGLYLHLAMLNHDTYCPNSVKFADISNKQYSEVRTNQWVQPGQALTISYHSK